VTVLTSLDGEQLAALGIQPELAAEFVKLFVHRAKIAQEAGCAGIVCSGHEVRAVKEECGDDLLVVTPGIRPEWGDISKDDQRRIVTPYQAVRNGADYIVVGRPIRTATDPIEAAVMVANEIERGLEDR
jgi:orotidine-5'-phosphate decarboxylase